MKSTKNNMPRMEVLMATIYYLMTRYARQPDRQISDAIATHLQLLSQHPECDSDILQKAGNRLSAQWKDEIKGQHPELLQFDRFINRQSPPKIH
ncbi:MAG: hypothetical protein AAF410_03800 [Pseudomonadota bacterium]